ncbi:hypothetical protein FRB90_008710 [Tulasnella sp. 427]|nr:hypothetical protein FRB90_008710 [Tulasnella sp. 427]
MFGGWEDSRWDVDDVAFALRFDTRKKWFLAGADKPKHFTSNVFFKHDLDEDVRMTERYRIWTTQSGKGREVAVLGVRVEDDKTAAAGVTIQSIADIVKENWFVYSILGSNPNLFLLVGHMSLSYTGDKWNDLHAAIRQKHPITHIFMFSGHTPNRDCRMDFDAIGHGRSIALESGRYLETVDWVGATLTDPSKPVKLVRRYLDPNRESFLRHSGVDKGSFDTEIEKEVMRKFDELAGRMGLDEFYGCAPQTYHWDHEKYSENAKDRVLNFYMDQVFPDVVNVRDAATGEKRPYFALLNNGLMRGPIYKGEFTKNDKYINTPYKQRFSYIRLPRLIVERVFEMLDNLQGAEDVVTDFSTAYLRNELIRKFMLTSPGYVTKDRCEQQLGPGDDTIHSSSGLCIQYPPTYVYSRFLPTPNLDKYNFVDLVAIQRLEDRVCAVANAAIALHNGFCEDK